MIITSILCANAQIKYSDGSIKINGADKKLSYKLTAKDWNGTYLTCKDRNFFQVDVTPANPRIAGTGNQVVFFNTETSTFNNIQVANVYNYSDARAKENIQDIQSGLNTISQLRPVSYEWKSEYIKIDSLRNLTPVGPTVSEKQQLGFLAQDLESVIPDIVESDNHGFKVVNYIAIIPVLVKAVQELQKIVDNQTTVIEQLKSSNGLTVQTENENKIVKCATDGENNLLIVSTELSDNASNAKLLISSVTGDSEKSIYVNKDNSIITEDVSNLHKGVHVATLYVNNTPVDSKNWIKK